MTKSKFPTDCKSRMAAYAAYFSDPAYEAHPFDPFTDITTPRRRRRSLSLKRVIAQAHKAGVDVMVAPDGTITLRHSVLGTLPNTTEDASEWN